MLGGRKLLDWQGKLWGWEEEALGLAGRKLLDCEGKLWGWRCSRVGRGSSGAGRRKLLDREEEAPELGGQALRLSSGVGRRKLWVIV